MALGHKFSKLISANHQKFNNWPNFTPSKISHSMVYKYCFCSYGTDYVSMKWDEVNCASSSYLSVAQCSYTYIGGYSCSYSNSYDATVYCCKIRQFKLLCNDIVQILLESGTVIHSLVWYVFKEELILMEDVWKCFVMDSGGQYAVLGLELLMLTPFASNWDMMHMIQLITYHRKLLCYCELLIHILQI